MSIWTRLQTISSWTHFYIFFLVIRKRSVYDLFYFSHTSGVTLLGVPADVYAFGASYFLASISLLIIATLTVLGFIPVFYKLQITSTYEYLERRFDERIRKCSSFLFALCTFIYLPIVMYLSAITFSAGK